MKENKEKMRKKGKVNQKTKADSNLSHKPKVLVFGTFDLLHKGHEYHLKKASKYGKLFVVVARDSTVAVVKNKVSVHSEKERMQNISKLNFVHKVLLGDRTDRYKRIMQIKPDIICLGYDQKHFTKNLKNVLIQKGLNVRIIRFRKAHFPNKYKTSIISAQLNKIN
jgi:FAD synthetase